MFFEQFEWCLNHFDQFGIPISNSGHSVWSEKTSCKFSKGTFKQITNSTKISEPFWLYKRILLANLLCVNFINRSILLKQNWIPFYLLKLPNSSLLRPEWNVRDNVLKLRAMVHFLVQPRTNNRNLHVLRFCIFVYVYCKKERQFYFTLENPYL